MVKLKRYLTSLIICLCTSWVLCLSAFAGQNASDDYLATIPESGDVATLVTMLGTDYDNDCNPYFRVDNTVSPAIVYVWDGFCDLSYTVKTDAINNLVADLQDSSVSNLTKQSIYKSMSENLEDQLVAHMPEIVEATSADIWAGIAVFMPFQSTFGTVLGLFVILIVLLLLFSTLIDLVYIGAPTWINWLVRSRKDPEALRFVSYDAQNVAKQNAAGTLSGSPYLYYAQKRFVSYIVLAVCILYLLSGQIGSLIKFFLDVASGMTGI